VDGCPASGSGGVLASRIVRRAPLLTLLLSLAFLLGCPPEPEPEPEPATPDPRIAELAADPSDCGAPSYAWLPADSGVGDVVTSELDPEWELPPTFYAPILEGQLGVNMPREPIHAARVLQLRYLTQDRGELVEATGLVGVPDIGPITDFPLLLLLHGTAGFSDDCAPSTNGLDPVLVSMLASFGYVVVAPDYLGMNGIGGPSDMLHPYLVGEPTAVASMDAVRATLQLSEEGRLRSGARATTPIIVSGGSQGGHASLFVARWAPYYAPEIPIAAVAASVPPSDLAGQTASAVLQWDDGTNNTAALLAAAADWYQTPGAALSEVLVPPLDVDVPARMEVNCGLGGLLNPADSAEEAFTADALAAMAADPIWSGMEPWECFIQANSLDTAHVEELVSIPTMFVSAEADELVDVAVERAAVERLCEQGIRIEYVECAGAEHTQGAFASFSEQLDFVDARLRGDDWDEAGICVVGEPVVCSGMQE
jgi:acetyl esterase/lipase